MFNAQTLCIGNLGKTIMKVDQAVVKAGALTFSRQVITEDDQVPFVLVFGDRMVLNQPEIRLNLQKSYPGARIISASSSGDIVGTSLDSGELSITAVSFNQTPVAIHPINFHDYGNSYEAGKSLAQSFNHEGLKHIFLISDGQIVNGSDLAKGIHDHLLANVTVSGGLAGDDTRFQSTLVGLDDDLREGNIIGIGFYGTNIQIGLGSMGGWDSFGPERQITKASGNVLYELDGENALDLYKIYLGDKAKELPGSALLFPLQIIVEGKPEPLVRTILNVNEQDKSMIFAGDIPQGAKAQFMKANFDKLIDGASIAAEYALNRVDETQPELAILVSCVGRKLVLGQRTEEELEAVREVLGNHAALAGFYSYGELCPTLNNNYAELHNQTMTITTFREGK